MRHSSFTLGTGSSWKLASVVVRRLTSYLTPTPDLIALVPGSPCQLHSLPVFSEAPLSTPIPLSNEYRSCSLPRGPVTMMPAAVDFCDRPHHLLSAAVSSEPCSRGQLCPLTQLLSFSTVLTPKLLSGSYLHGLPYHAHPPTTMGCDPLNPLVL